MSIKAKILSLLSKPFLAFYKFNLKEIEKLKNASDRQEFGYIHPSVVMHQPIHISAKSNVFIGEKVNIAPFVQIWANARVTIGKNTLIASHAIITTSTHDYSVQPHQSKRIDKEVNIGEDVWIGSGAIIFPGIKIGDGAVIGAGALVNKDVEAYSVNVGSPARKIKNRFENRQ